MIARLLSHYWAAGEPDALRRDQARDWLDDLREFGPEIVSIACGEWRRSQSRRPTIGDIRTICIREQQERRASQPKLVDDDGDDYARSLGWSSAEERRAALRAVEAKRAETHREMQLEGRAIVNDWAREQGHPDIDAYARAHGVHWATAYRRCVHSICEENEKIRTKRDPLRETRDALGVGLEQ